MELKPISPILEVTKLSLEYDKVCTKEKMKFNNGDEIFTKKLIRSSAKQVGLLLTPGTQEENHIGIAKVGLIYRVSQKNWY